MVQIEVGDLPTTQFTVGAVAKAKGCPMKEAKEALLSMVDAGVLNAKTAKSGAINFSLPKNAKNAKRAGTAKTSPAATEPVETTTTTSTTESAVDLPADGSLEQFNAAKVESKAVKEWKANGEQGERPATPNHDRMRAIAAENGGTMPKTKTRRASTKSSNGTAAPRGTTVRFFVDDKPMPDSQNKLSSVAWYHTAGVCGDDSKRCSVTELRKILADVKITDPSNSEWSVELSNGKTIHTETM